jgi:hypothetical protein
LSSSKEGWFGIRPCNLKLYILVKRTMLIVTCDVVEYLRLNIEPSRVFSIPLGAKRICAVSTFRRLRHFLRLKE